MTPQPKPAVGRQVMEVMVDKPLRSITLGPMAKEAAPSGPQAPVASLVPVHPGSELARVLAEAVPGLVGADQLLVVALDETIDAIKLQTAAREALELMERTDLEHVVSLLAPELGVPSAAVLEQARRNLLLREELIREFGALNAREVAELAGSEALNRSQFAHSLLRSGRVFSVAHRRAQLFPAFQFEADGPLPIVSDVLPALRSRFRKDWEIALWFTTKNAWLDGRRPVDLLQSNPTDVMEAAQAGADRGGF